MNRAIFINKDAEFKKDNQYKINPDLITFLTLCSDGLSLLQGWGYKIVVISNQPGIARGLFEEIDLLDLQVNLKEVFNVFSLRLDGFYYCPHLPEGSVLEYAISCKCRKPQPELYFKAARELNINLSRSWMIGDVPRDMEAGKRAGCKTLLVNNGKELDWSVSSYDRPDFITYDFGETAEFIISSNVSTLTV